MAGAIASLVGTVQLKLKIERATTSDDEPTPSTWGRVMMVCRRMLTSSVKVCVYGYGGGKVGR